MSATYAEGGQESTAAGGFLLAAISLLAGVLVIAGLIYATGNGARHKAALAAADCEPSLFISGFPCTTQQMMADQYQAIVNPAITQLKSDASAYAASQGHNLAAAESALTAEVTTERALDQSLAAVAFTPQNLDTADSLIQSATSNGTAVPMASVLFTPQATAIANALVRADHTLEKLTAEQARSPSLTQLRSFNSGVVVATVAVQTKLKLLRRAVETRITVNQEP
jgi:hypothetical protein